MRKKMLIVGLAAALSPAVGAQPPETSTSMVFFDWGKHEIRRDDEAVLDKAAEAWRARPGARLRLTGHTDRSGAPGFNHRSGMDRAETVRTALEKRGIPRNSMSLASFGEGRPLVPTEDGVREVQNRRVEISFEE